MDMNRNPSNVEMWLIAVLLSILVCGAMILASGCHTIHGIGEDLKCTTSHYIGDPQ